MAFDLEAIEKACNGYAEIPQVRGCILELAREVAHLRNALVHYQKDTVQAGDLQRSRLVQDDARLSVLERGHKETQRIVHDLGNNVQAVLLANAELSHKVEHAPDKEELDTLRSDMRIGDKQIEQLRRDTQGMQKRLYALEELTGDPDFKEVPERLVLNQAVGGMVGLAEPAPPQQWPHVAIQRTANGWLVSAPEWTQGGPYTIKEAYVFTTWTDCADFCRRVLEQPS
jgi:hypothetical protein